MTTAALRRVATYRASIPLPPEEAFRKLAEAFAADPYTRVAHVDHATRRLRVEGQGGYVGELSVDPDGTGAIATLAAMSTAKRGPKAWVRERLAQRFTKRHFRDAVAAAAVA